MANVRSLMTGSAVSLAIVLGASLLAACNNSETSAAKTGTETSTAVPAAKTDGSAAKDVPAGGAAKALDDIKAKLARASSADIQQKSEELWTAKDYASAVAVAEMAYKLDGNKNAAYRLGTAYYGGSGVEKDLAKAAEYLSIPALDDVSYALYYRGLVLADKAYKGFDASKARMSLEKAKQMGVAEAEDAIKALPSN
jgi:TPR repeat protein